MCTALRLMYWELVVIAFSTLYDHKHVWVSSLKMDQICCRLIGRVERMIISRTLLKSAAPLLLGSHSLRRVAVINSGWHGPPRLQRFYTWQERRYWESRKSTTSTCVTQFSMFNLLIHTHHEWVFPSQVHQILTTLSKIQGDQKVTAVMA